MVGELVVLGFDRLVEVVVVGVAESGIQRVVFHHPHIIAGVGDTGVNGRFRASQAGADAVAGASSS